MPLSLLAVAALRCVALRPLLVLAAAVAWTCWWAGERLADRLPADALGQDFELTGTVGGFPSPAPGQMTFRFDVAEPRPAGVPRRVRLTWYDAPPLTAGDALKVTARLRPPRGTRNPGGFDYEQWLLVNGYGATGYVRARRACAGGQPRRRYRMAAVSRRARCAHRPRELRRGRRGVADGARARRALSVHRAALGRLSPHGHEPSRGRLGHARRAARSRRVRGTAPRVAAVAATARELRPRGCGCGERARNRLLRGAHGFRGAGAALARDDRDSARGAR